MNGIGMPLLNSNSNGPLKSFVKFIIRLQNSVSNKVLMIQITQRNILLYYFFIIQYNTKPSIIEFMDHMGEIFETTYIRQQNTKESTNEIFQTILKEFFYLQQYKKPIQQTQTSSYFV